MSREIFDQYANNLVSIKRKLECLHENPPLDMKMLEAEKEKSSELQLAIYHAKMSFSWLKDSMLDEMETLYFFISLQSGKDPSEFNTAVIDHVWFMAESGAGAEDWKQKLSNIKSSVEEKADQIQSKYKIYCHDLEECQALAAQFDTKVEKLRQLIETTPEAESQMRECKIRSAKLALEKAEADLQCIKEEQDRTQQLIIQVLEQIDECKYLKHEKKRNTADLNQWAERGLSLLAQLTGCRIKSLHTNTCVIECFHGNNDAIKLEVTLTFDRDVGPRAGLTHAKVNMERFGMRSILEEGVVSQNLVYMVSRLAQIWSKHSALVNEMEGLMHKYAVDWQHTEGKLQMLCGKDAGIMCTLHIDDGYPATGSVSLAHVSGLPDHITPDQIEPTSALTSLTAWLDHLHETLE